MKNKNGFTIIELVVSFVLVATISLTLLQLVLSLKEVYLSGEVKTTLLNKQGLMTKNIYDDLNEKDLSSLTSCGLSCLTFTYADSTVKDLLLDPGNKTITYGDYTIQLDDSSSFGTINVDVDENATSLDADDDSVFKIDIPVSSKLIENEDFGFHIIKTYNRNITTIDTTTDITSTKVTISGVDTDMTMIYDETNTSQVLGTFVKIFHQNNSNKLNTNFDNFIKNKDINTFSALKALEAFRTTFNVDQIMTLEEDIIKTEALSNKEQAKNIKTMKETFQNGYFSLLLNYNNQDLNTNSNYLWWYQTSNFASKEKLNGFSISYDDNLVAPNGLTYNSDSNNKYWANIAGEAYNLGAYTDNGVSAELIDLNGSIASSVDLYVEAREYICRYSLSKLMYTDPSTGLRVPIKNITLADGKNFCLTQ